MRSIVYCFATAIHISHSDIGGQTVTRQLKLADGVYKGSLGETSQHAIVVVGIDVADCVKIIDSHTIA